MHVLFVRFVVILLYTLFHGQRTDNSPSVAMLAMLKARFHRDLINLLMCVHSISARKCWHHIVNFSPRAIYLYLNQHQFLHLGIIFRFLRV